MSHSPPAVAFFRHALDSVLPVLEGQLERLRQGHHTPELVHELRVQLRRLRTLVWVTKALCTALPPEWDTTLAGVARQLGRWRDQASGAQAVAPLLQGTKAPTRGWVVPSRPVHPLRDLGHHAALLATLAQLHALHGEGSPTSFVAWSDRRTRRHVRSRLARLEAQIAQVTPGFRQLPLADQHRARKRLKRLRYLAEFAQAFWPEAFARHRAAAKAMARAQDALGLHHDVGWASARFRQEARTDARAWFAAGFLQASLRLTARDAEKSLKRLCKAFPTA